MSVVSVATTVKPTALGKLHDESFPWFSKTLSSGEVEAYSERLCRLEGSSASSYTHRACALSTTGYGMTLKSTEKEALLSPTTLWSTSAQGTLLLVAGKKLKVKLFYFV